MRCTWLFLLPLLACDPPEVADTDDSGGGRDADTDADSDADSDADADADSDSDSDTDPGPVDADNDGSFSDVDCDDNDDTVFPGQTEVCNLKDDDCDGDVDSNAVDRTTWYLDSDFDGFGDDTNTQVSCGPPADHVPDGGDCNDANEDVNPGEVEVCNGIDDDCNGDIDGDATNLVDWFQDADTDTFGNASVMVTACNAPAQHVADSTDCDDTDAAINPGQDELCDAVDRDCSGFPDDDAIDATAWYQDTDGDGFGDAGVATDACSQPSGYVADSTDCDDAVDTVYPGASEVPSDGVDQDCNGSDLTVPTDFYVSQTFGSAGATGTMSDPFDTVQEAADAAALAGNLPVRIAAGSYGENVTTDVPLLGGYDDTQAGWPRTLDRTAVSINRVTMQGPDPSVQTMTLNFGIICSRDAQCAIDDVHAGGTLPLEIPLLPLPCGTELATVTNSRLQSGGSWGAQLSCGQATFADSIVSGQFGINFNSNWGSVERTDITASGGALNMTMGGVVRDSTLTTTGSASVGVTVAGGFPPDGTDVVIENSTISGADTAIQMSGQYPITFTGNTVTGDDVGADISMVWFGSLPLPFLTFNDNDISVAGATGAASIAVRTSRVWSGEFLRNAVHVGPTSVITSSQGVLLNSATQVVFANNEVVVESSPARDYGIVVTNQFETDAALTLVNNTVWVEGGGIDSQGLRDARNSVTTEPIVAANNIFVVAGGTNQTPLWKSTRGPIDSHYNLLYSPDTAVTIRDGLTDVDAATATSCGFGWAVCDSMNVIDPMFTDALGGDFTVGLSSPAVDQGVDPVGLGLLTTAQAGSDLVGNPRPLGSDWDRGAHEQ